MGVDLDIFLTADAPHVFFVLALKPGFADKVP
jgi:hypothetical protein